MADIRQQIPDEVIKVGAVTPTTSDNALTVSLSPNSASTPVTINSDANGRAKVVQSDLAVTATLAAASATGATATVGSGIAGIQLTGTWVGTITFQGTQDPLAATAPAASWFNVNGVASVTGLQVTSTTTNGQWRVNAGGYTAVRAIMTVFTSGSATVWINSSAAASMATLAEPLPAGANTIGAVNIAATQTLAAVTAITNALPAGTNNIGKVNAATSATGGATPFTLISAATTNATSVKATAGTVYSIQASNTGAAVAFLKLYNLAVAPTVGTSVAIKTLIIPAGGGIVFSGADVGIAFTTGISLATTGLATTADVTAVALNQVVANVDYA